MLKSLNNFFNRSREYLFSVLFLSILLFAPAHAQMNVPHIGDYGAWNTIYNQNMITDMMRGDLDRFGSRFSNEVLGPGGQLVPTFVPLEARVGRAMIGALNEVSQIINRSLGGFISVMLAALFAFWIMMESYQVATTGGDVKKLAYEIARKGLWIAAWFIILNSNPAHLFMLVASPIISAGRFVSDGILGAVTQAAGLSLPDTCGAIHAYMEANPIRGAEYAIIDARATADLLCVPTRLAGFFYICIAAGLRWLQAGIGNSVITFIAGAIFVVIFVRNAWLFAIDALGVIASLFLAIMLLPFTVVAECFDGKTSFKDQGLFSKFFGMLVSMLGGEKLKLRGQLMIFINAAIYYVALSIVAGIGLALLGVVAKTDFAGAAPTIENTDFMLVLIVGALVSHLANRAGEIAGYLGGSIDENAKGFSKQIGDDISTARKNVVGKTQSWWKAIRAK
jgi:hypothetical protein